MRDYFCPLCNVLPELTFLDKDMKIEANDNVSLMVMMSLYKTKP